MTIGWTSFNYPSSISGTGVTSSFNYTFDRRKYRQDATYVGGGSSTTIYVDDLLEKVTDNGTGIIDFRYQIVAGNARIVVTRATSNANNIYYLTDDHLGSSSEITGSSTASLSYGPFGNRRGSNWQGFPSAADQAAIKYSSRTGFTQHTMLDNLGLIHMRGRVQDPVLGRFVSADPHITDPLNPQSFNRYSYVVNNPLSLTDPSGFDYGDIPPPRPNHWPRDPMGAPPPIRPPFGFPCANHCGNPNGVRTPPPMQTVPCDLMPCSSQSDSVEPVEAGMGKVGAPEVILGACTRTPAGILACSAGAYVVYRSVEFALNTTAGRLLRRSEGNRREWVGRGDAMATGEEGSKGGGPPMAGASESTNVGPGQDPDGDEDQTEGGPREIVASNGTRVRGYTGHGVQRAVGDGASRAGTSPRAVLDALRNPRKIVEGVDSQGRPYQVFTGRDARVVVNPQTGEIVSMNPLSRAGVRGP
jgi:RHS repeat-associated protein